MSYKLRERFVGKAIHPNWEEMSIEDQYYCYGYEEGAGISAWIAPIHDSAMKEAWLRGFEDGKNAREVANES